MRKISIFIIILLTMQANIAFAIQENWLNIYNDEILLKNINLVYVQNQDLKIATYKTKQMQDIVKMSFAKQLPQMSLMGNISHTFSSSDQYRGTNNFPIYNFTQTQFLLPVGLNYEIDLWGRNYLATKSSKQDALIAEQDENLIRLIIESNFAACYFNLVKTDELIKKQEKLLKLQAQILKITDIQYKNGYISKENLLKEEQIYNYYKITFNDYKEKQKLLNNQLLVLLGDRNNVEINRNQLDSLKVPTFPQELNSEIIAKRPDYIKSELYVKKLGYDVKVARRDFFPKLILYGNIEFNAYNNSLPQRTFMSNIGILPQFDIFSGGLKLARLRYIKTECKKALEMYEKTILVAMQEVNDSLVSTKKNKENFNEAIKNKKLEDKKYKLSGIKYKTGDISLLKLLFEQRNLLETEKETISSKVNYLISGIELYKAAGGYLIDEETKNL